MEGGAAIIIVFHQLKFIMLAQDKSLNNKKQTPKRCGEEANRENKKEYFKKNFSLPQRSQVKRTQKRKQKNQMENLSIWYN
jgi:hypothetical protein